MATNIPPHNLREVVDGGRCTLIDNPDATIGDLRKLIKGPDFPTGGYIYGRSGHQGLPGDGARPDRHARARA